MNIINNGSIDFKPVFECLNDELCRIGQSLEIICAGGYVLQMHGYRATADVDAFYKSDAKIQQIIKKVGDDFKINKLEEIWLNNSIANMNPKPPYEYCEIVHEFSNLIVKSVSLMYLIGMKLISAREQDLIDVGAILRHEHNKQPLELLLKLKGMEFQIDLSYLLDAFEEAHGMEWLEQFYFDNENELKKYF